MNIEDNIVELYQDGSKCAEYINDLSDTDTMIWEEIYRRTKYLYTYGRDICDNDKLIYYLNECFNHGLSVKVNQECYIDVRKMQSALYISDEKFDKASNCILAVLDITEDVPVEMFLDLTYAEIHTDLLRILKSPEMFFNDLHTADENHDLIDSQKNIVKKLLLKTVEAKTKDPDIFVDNASIEKQVIDFGLTESKEYDIYRRVIAGESVSGVISAPDRSTENKEFTQKKILPAFEQKASVIRNEYGLLELDIFPEDNKEEVSRNEEANIDLKGIETMMSNIMTTVTENSKRIANLQDKFQSTSDYNEMENVKTEPEQGETENKALREQLKATKAQLAEREKENSVLAKTIENQKAIMEKKKNAEFKEEELNAFGSFERVIVIDTCSLEYRHDLFEYINDKEMVRISKTVLAELENHKKHPHDKEKQKMGQAGLKAIKKAIKMSALPYSCVCEDSYTFLLPESLQIKSEDELGTKNDKEIFSVAMRYKLYSTLPVIVISDDTTIQVMAQAEHIESMSAEEFIEGREKNVDIVSYESDNINEFLRKKFTCKEYTLSQHEVLVLKKYGIITVGDLLSKTDEEISRIKDKKGINYTARIAYVCEKIKKDYARLFGDAESE